eukprot:2213042-Pyramimonas_sp.AAC.1
MRAQLAKGRASGLVDPPVVEVTAMGPPPCMFWGPELRALMLSQVRYIGSTTPNRRWVYTRRWVVCAPK